MVINGAITALPHDLFSSSTVLGNCLSQNPPNGFYLPFRKFNILAIYENVAFFQNLEVSSSFQPMTCGAGARLDSVLFN
jgi:hypothetical protein